MDSEEEFDKLSKPKIIKTDEGMMRLLVDTILRLERKIDKLIPEVKDNSKSLASMKESLSCVQPSNHGRKGTMPRSRKGCFAKVMSKGGYKPEEPKKKIEIVKASRELINSC